MMNNLHRKSVPSRIFQKLSRAFVRSTAPDTTERSEKASRLVIHAGLHKTASTTLQVGLGENRSALETQAIHYPAPIRGNAHHAVLSLWNSAMSRFGPEHGDGRDVWQKIDALSKPGHTTILSSEEFSRFGRQAKVGEGAVDFDEVLALTRSYDLHQVVCVVREQVSFLQSIFLQIRNQNQNHSFRTWLSWLPKNDFQHVGIYTDYNALDHRLVASFGSMNVSYISYETISHNYAGPVGRFLAHIGYDYVPNLRIPRTQNVAPSPLGYQLARTALEGAMPTSEQISVAERELLLRHPGKTKTSLYHKEDLVKIAAYFEKKNARFSEQVGKRLSGNLTLGEVDPNTLYACEITPQDSDHIRNCIRAC